MLKLKPIFILILKKKKKKLLVPLPPSPYLNPSMLGTSKNFSCDRRASIDRFTKWKAIVAFYMELDLFLSNKLYKRKLIFILNFFKKKIYVLGEKNFIVDFLFNCQDSRLYIL